MSDEVIDAQRTLGLMFSVNFLYSCVTGALVVATMDSSNAVLKDTALKNHMSSLVFTLYVGAAAALLPVSNLRGSKLKWYNMCCWVMAFAQVGAQCLAVAYPGRVTKKDFNADMINNVHFFLIAPVNSTAFLVGGVLYLTGFLGNYNAASSSKKTT